MNSTLQKGESRISAFKVKGCPALPSSSDREILWASPHRPALTDKPAAVTNQTDGAKKHGQRQQLELWQSVRLSHYGGSHMEMHTCAALTVNEFTEAKRLLAKFGSMAQIAVCHIYSNPSIPKRSSFQWLAVEEHGFSVRNGRLKVLI